MMIPLRSARMPVAANSPAFQWTAPLILPMMVTVVYLSSKLGHVAGKGPCAVVRDRYPRWVPWSTLIGVLIACRGTECRSSRGHRLGSSCSLR
jgi:Mn2+/Fe2+ NRAMP family transporter